MKALWPYIIKCNLSISTQNTDLDLYLLSVTSLKWLKLYQLETFFIFFALFWLSDLSFSFWILIKLGQYFILSSTTWLVGHKFFRCGPNGTISLYPWHDTHFSMMIFLIILCTCTMSELFYYCFKVYMWRNWLLHIQENVAKK